MFRYSSNPSFRKSQVSTAFCSAVKNIEHHAPIKYARENQTPSIEEFWIYMHQ